MHTHGIDLLVVVVVEVVNISFIFRISSSCSLSISSESSGTSLRSGIGVTRARQSNPPGFSTGGRPRFGVTRTEEEDGSFVEIEADEDDDGC